MTTNIDKSEKTTSGTIVAAQVDMLVSCGDPCYIFRPGTPEIYLVKIKDKFLWGKKCNAFGFGTWSEALEIINILAFSACIIWHDSIVHPEYRNLDS